MKKITFIISIISIILVFPLSLFAQDDDNDKRVKIFREYEPMIDDAFKVKTQPVIMDSVVKKDVVNYKISPRKLNTNIEVKPIKAAKMEGQKLSKLYPLFLKAGFGNKTTPYAELFYNSLRSRKSMYNLHYRHFSSSGEIPGYAFSGFSENEFNVNSNFYGKKYNYNVSGHFDRNVVHYYGRPDGAINDTIKEKEDIRQMFRTFRVEADLESKSRKRNHINHYLNTSFYNYADMYNTGENYVYGNAGIYKEVEWFKFTRKQKVGLDADISYFNTKYDGDTLTAGTFTETLINIRPFIQAKKNQFQFKIGVVANVVGSENNKLRVFPDASVKINIRERQFIVHGGINGGVQHNSYRSLSMENPFIAINPEYKNTVNKIHVYGGLTSRITKYLNFNFHISSKSFDNMALFVADTSEVLRNKFTTVYNNGKLLHIKAELGFHYGEKFKVLVAGHIMDYNMTDIVDAWHHPEAILSVNAYYNIQNAFYINAEIQSLNKIKAREWDGTKWITTDLNNILDINLGVEYRYSKFLSMFARFNNLAGSKYNRWQYYPAYRFNFLAGITYAI